jgi:hypothetical protein
VSWVCFHLTLNRLQRQIADLKHDLHHHDHEP